MFFCLFSPFWLISFVRVLFVFKTMSSRAPSQKFKPIITLIAVHTQPRFYSNCIINYCYGNFWLCCIPPSCRMLRWTTATTTSQESVISTWLGHRYCPFSPHSKFLLQAFQKFERPLPYASQHLHQWLLQPKHFSLSLSNTDNEIIYICLLVISHLLQREPISLSLDIFYRPERSRISQDLKGLFIF